MAPEKLPTLPWAKDRRYPAFTYDFEPDGVLSVYRHNEPGSSSRWEWSASIRGERFASGAEPTARRAAYAAECAVRDLWGGLVLDRFDAVNVPVVEWFDWVESTRK